MSLGVNNTVEIRWASDFFEISRRKNDFLVPAGMAPTVLPENETEASAQAPLAIDFAMVSGLDTGSTNGGPGVVCTTTE
jgi:hypothetical protein